MSRRARAAAPVPPPAASDPEAPFRCANCGAAVEPLRWGGRHRNHCPACLCSLHVDAERDGDRASRCRGVMEPVGWFERRTGERVVVQRCRTCGAERHNRTAADDNVGRLEALPRVEPRVRGGQRGG